MARKRTRQPVPVSIPAPEPGELRAEIPIVQKRILDLVPSEYNPRAMTPQERQDLVNSIIKFKMVEPIVVNVHPDRLNVVIGGHQRLSVLVEMGYKYVPCVELSLSQKDEKELNLRLNKNLGHWDGALLKKHFSRDDLKMVGFLDSELVKLLEEDADKLKAALSQDEPTFPIVPRVDEGYDGVLVFCKSKIDMLWLREIMGLEKERSYKCESVGETRVVPVATFRQKLNAYVKSHGGKIG